MSEIFLKLRIKEIFRGKMKRYLIFGIVEVFLVVAGILIALSINNWDNKKTQRRDELNIYKNIRAKITEDRELIQSVSEYNNRYLLQFQLAQSQVNNGELKLLHNKSIQTRLQEK